MISAPVICREFIGRRQELELLDARYRDAVAGNGSIVLIAGEAGIGKTRLLAEARASFQAAGARCVAGQCLEYARSPLAPIIDTLRELDAVDPSILTAAPELRAALRRLLGDAGESDDLNAPGADDRRTQYAAITETLRRFARARTTVLTIEDLHWADLATPEFLQYLAGRLNEARLLVLVTMRINERDEDAALAGAVDRLEATSAVWRLQLDALSEPDINALMQFALRDRGKLADRTLSRIRKLAEGSPFFAEELLKQALFLTDTQLPRSIRSTVQQRLMHVGESDRIILRHAAVVGRRFEAGFLAAVAGEPMKEVLAVLRRARDLHLVVEEDGIAGRFAFRHALVREALYGELLAAEARLLHQRITAALSELPGDHDRAAEIAYHAWAARDAENAVRYNETAGNDAMMLLAHSDAVVFFERALEFVSKSERRYAEISNKLGMALSRAGFPERARRAYEEAITFYRDVGDMRKVAELALEIGQEYTNEPKSEDWQQWPIRALEAMESAKDDPLYHAALVRLARGYMLRGDDANALKLLREAELHEGTPLATSRVLFYDTRGTVYASLGYTQRSLADYEKAIELAKAERDLRGMIRSYQNLGTSATYLGEIDVAQRACEHAVRIARENFMPRMQFTTLVTCAEAKLAAGMIEEARQLVNKAASLAMELGWTRMLAAMAAIGVSIGMKLGDEQFLQRFARDEAIETAFASNEVGLVAPAAAAFAELYAAQGDHERARALLRRAIDVLVDELRVPHLAVSVALYGYTEDIPRVRELLQRWAAPKENRAGRAFLALFDACSARRAGRSSIDDGKDAALRFASIGLPYFEALSLEAANRSAEAAAIYRRIGVRRTDTITAGTAAARRSKNGLTTREAEVAKLVAAGKSNRAIGETLCISERTVETHIASIFGKLGVSSRVDLIRLMPEGDRNP